MDTDTLRATAHRANRVLDPLHSMVYFAPELEQELTAIGLRPGRMIYFATRAAPMGLVGPGAVTATFHNFSPDIVARHIPRAWTLASRDDILAARLTAADRALRKLLGDAVAAPELAEAADLARRASDACTPEGRPLYAGHAELDWPTEPHLVLWHAITLLREYRGDGHTAALVAAGLTGLEALITHTATGRGFLPEPARLSRGWSEQQWAAATQRLRDSGILADDGGLAEAGQRLRAGLEEVTNDAAAAPWLAIGEQASTRLIELGRAFSKQIVAAGAFPADTFAN